MRNRNPVKPAHKKARFWRLLRIYFRRFRITVWLVLLALVGCLLYLDQVGLPGFVKRPLLQKLRAQGLDLQFSRLRLRRLHELVADKVVFESSTNSLSPRLTVREVQVRLNHEKLWHLQFEVAALGIRQGQLTWPIVASNQAPRELNVEGIQTYLRFLPGDQWELDHFQAKFAGAAIQLSGTLTNASAVRDWGRYAPKEGPSPAGLWQNRLRQLADTLEQIRFPTPPILNVRVNGDARDLQSFDVKVWLAAAGAETPWGSFDRGRLNVRLFPANTNEYARAELDLEAGAAGWTNAPRTCWAASTNIQILATFMSSPGETNLANASLIIRAQQAVTAWGEGTNLQLTLDLGHDRARTNLVEGSLALSAANARTPWAAATNLHLTAQWLHALTNPVPLAGESQLDCERLETAWGASGRLRFKANLAEAATNPPALPDSSWDWWNDLQPYVLNWEAEFSEVKSPRGAAERIVGRGHWRAPELVATNLHAELYQGHFDAQAALNVGSRSLQGSLESNVDPHRIWPLLFAEEPRWLAACVWDRPPEVKAQASLVLPPWTNHTALTNWRTVSQPSLVFLGEITIATNAAYHGASFSAAHSHLIYSNLAWRLPDVLVTRPEGRIEAIHEASDVTGDFSWRVASTIHPGALRPLFATNQQAAFDFFELTNPPALEFEVRGRGQDMDGLGAGGRVALTNFTFRGQSISTCRTEFQYTNRVLRFMEPRITRGTQQLNAASVAIDFQAEKILITNGFSTTDPMVVARAIGPHIVRIMEPYRFTRPPTVRGQGVLPIHGEEVADFHFDLLEGSEFHWWKFTVQQVSGRIHWLSHRLTLQDIQMDFYGGQAAGAAAFNFQPPGRDGTDYQFTLLTTNTFLQSLVADLFPGTNKLSGFLSGLLSITNANTSDDRSAQGFGKVTLREGLIWDFPVFGFLSPVLNNVAPGMGNSRASAAAGTFSISNSVIYSDDLDIRTTGMRLQYHGTVDLEGRVNARAEGSPLRDIPLVGPVFSTLFLPMSKLFEYRVTGTLSAPKTEPLLFVPKVILFPFHPFRTLKDLMTDDSSRATTNYPAIKGP